MGTQKKETKGEGNEEVLKRLGEELCEMIRKKNFPLANIGGSIEQPQWPPEKKKEFLSKVNASDLMNLYNTKGEINQEVYRRLEKLWLHSLPIHRIH